MSQRLPFMLLCLVVLAAVVSLAENNPGALSTRDALGVLSFAGRMPIALSSDGDWVAYTVEDDRKRENTADERYMYYTRTGAFSEAVGCDVLITNTRTGRTRNLTQGKGTSSSPVWSPDGKLLAFYSDRSGTERLWIWNRDTDEMHQLTDAIPRPFFNFQVPRWSPDGQSILLKVLPAGTSVEAAADLMVSPKPIKTSEPNGVTASVFTFDPQEKAAAGPKVNDERWMNRYNGDLALVEVSTGSIKHIVNGGRPLGFWFSPDGKYIAYTNWIGIQDNTQQPVYQIGVYSVQEKQSRVLVEKSEQDYGQSVSWSPDSRTLAYFSSKGDCFLIAATGGAQTNLTGGSPHPPFNDDHRAPLWDSSGKKIYLLSSEEYGRLGTNKVWVADVDAHSFRVLSEFPGNMVLEIAGARTGRALTPDGRSLLVLVRNDSTKDMGFSKLDQETGTVSPVFLEPRYFERDSIFSTDFSRDAKTMVYVAEDAQHPQDIWIASPGLQDRHQLTHIHSQLEQLNFGKVRVIDWRGIDGQPLRGALLLPSNYQEGKRYPLVVNVYGGSFRSSTVNRFGLSGAGVENLQILATRGYAVLLPDTPLRKKTPMTDLLKTVMPGVDRAIELGIADPEKLGVMGHSYGGYSTLSLIVQTNRFKAAVDSAGPANLISNYGSMDESGTSSSIGWSETGQGGMEGTPWEFRERYIENSPLFYLDRVVTPLLIIQGALDRAVPSTQADEVFVALRRLGKRVTYAKYAGEEHWEGTWSAANAEDYWSRVITWFDTYLAQIPPKPKTNQ